MGAEPRRWGCRRGSIIVWVLVFLVTASTSSIAGTYEDGMAAYNRGDFDAAFRLLRPLADDGNPLAQTRLALLYANGQGVRQDYTEAAKWERRAAEQGLAQAQANLGFAYQTGTGVPQDGAEAARWLLKAAQNGQEIAQVAVAMLYEDGAGVPKNYNEATTWYRKAAENGYPLRPKLDEFRRKAIEASLLKGAFGEPRHFGDFGSAK